MEDSKFLQLVNSRQSDRGYTDKPIEEEKLNLCIEAARMAPSASNSQPWTFILVNEPELKDKIAKATFSTLVSFNKFAVSAPVLLVIVIEKPRAVTQIGGAIKKREFPLIDIGITAEHFCLQAEELGLGTCMIGWFEENRIKSLLQIPKNKRLGLVITIGYPASDKKRKKIRKPINEVYFRNRYGV